MQDEFYCGCCGKRRPLSMKVEVAGKRPKCQYCEDNARANSTATKKKQTQAGSLTHPAPKLRVQFMRWVSHM